MQQNRFLWLLRDRMMAVQMQLGCQLDAAPEVEEC